MCFEQNGALLFVGVAKVNARLSLSQFLTLDQGHVYTFESDMGGLLKQLSRTEICAKPITSLDFSRWQGKVNNPTLLASCCDSYARLIRYTRPFRTILTSVQHFSVAEPSGALKVRKQLSVSQRTATVRSQICPLVAHRTRGTCIGTLKVFVLFVRALLIRCFHSNWFRGYESTDSGYRQ